MTSERSAARQASPNFPQRNAFVVRFSTAGDRARGALVGRVEHVASGDRATFTSLQGLWTFVSGRLERR
jgi:hypothetical protein